MEFQLSLIGIDYFPNGLIMDIGYVLLVLFIVKFLTDDVGPSGEKVADKVLNIVQDKDRIRTAEDKHHVDVYARSTAFVGPSFLVLGVILGLITMTFHGLFLMWYNYKISKVQR